MLAHVWIVALLLVQVPTASAGYYSCNSGWWLSGSDCYAYYGGQQYQSWVSSGYYGLKGTTSQTYCPAGFYCPGGTSYPTTCTFGTYSSGGASSCTTCSTTKNCQSGGSYSCSSGLHTYNGSGRWTRCHQCPPGYTCSSSTATQITSAGTYAVGGQISSATSCGGGRYCPSPTHSTSTSCPTGFYSTGSAGSCTAVSEGYYGSGSSQYSCSNGQYSNPGVTGCTTCPSGFYCPAPTGMPTKCAAGTYSGTGASSCTTCPDRYACSLTARGSICSNGYYSPSGSSVCSTCRAGKYCTSGYEYDCSDTYYSLGGATSCSSQTAAGYGKDTSKKSAGMLCGAGYYSDSSTSFVCTLCPKGYYCPDTTAKIACTSSQDCQQGSTSNSKACPPWYRCDQYTDALCPEGQYLNTAKNSCVNCPAGQVCTGRYEADNTAVDTGYFSPVGVSTQYICPAGYACDTNVAVACSSGWYSVEAAMTCTVCPAEYACPNTEIAHTDQIYCPNQRGMYNPSGTGQVECTPAPAGKYIEYGWLAAQIADCPTGTWSLGGALACHECPPGYICPSKVKPAMEKCIRGTYALNYNQITCDTCQAGYMCEAETRIACPTYKYSHSGDGFCRFTDPGYYLITDQTQQHACAAGTYAIFGSGDSAQGAATCQTCPVGHQCNNPAVVPQACLPGTYSASTGATSCATCASGTYSLFAEKECHTSPGGYKLASSSRVPRMCPPGTYSSSGSSSCTTTATYSYTAAGSQAAGECPWGFYCSSTGDGGTVTVVPISYQKSGSTTSGYYIPTIAQGTGSTGYSAAVTCTAGYYCPYGTMKQYPCPAGHYCPAGAQLPTPCAAGTFNIHIQQTSSAACSSNACPSQYFCNIGTKYPQPCSGTCDTSLMSSSTVVTCADGTYAGNDSPASASACNACWEGYYCPASLASNNAFPTPCPKGTYSSATNNYQASQCTACPAGMVCPYAGARTLETGLTCQPGMACPASTTAFRANPCPAGKYSDATPYLDDVSNCVTCPDGYICAEGTNTLYNPMTLALAGTYATGGTSTDCAAGTYSTQLGATSSAVCLPCPAGYFCAAATSDYSANVCEAGYYCPEGSSTGQAAACPTGTYSTTTGLKSVSECTICPLGYYCQNVQDAVTLVWSWTVTACPAGTYGSRIMLVSDTDSTGIRGCLPCPAGYICATAPTFEPVACAAGTYSAASATTCTACPVNYYCDREATSDTAYTLIPDGFYYTGGAGLAERPYHTSATYSCLPGYWCAGNVRTACAVGKYQPLYGQTASTACLTTPAGYYNNVEASTNFYDTPCPAGMYCLAGTTTNIGYAATDAQVGTNPRLCPKATFRSYVGGTQLADCGACPAGYVCSEFTVTPQICAQGYYCPQASESMQACPTGTFGSGTQLTALSDCSACFGGRYCMSIARSYVSGLCDQMYYCVQASNTPVPLYKTVGQTTDFLGRTFPVGDECAAGGFCATGSKFPKPCPSGNYNPSVRMIQESDCLSCPAGQYCSGAPATTTRTDILTDMSPYVPDPDPTGYCYAGYYCTGGAYSPKQFTAQPGRYTGVGASAEVLCAVGTYNPYIAQSGCLSCPAGYYCDQTGMSTPTPCPVGYYCPAGITSYSSYPCPVGTYGTQTHFYQVSQCQDCTSGKYCSSTAQTAVTGDCSAGYHCTASSTTATPSGTTNLNGQCPQHHYCAVGVAMGVPTLPGFWDTSVGRSTQTTTQVTQGSYSYTVSATSTYFSTPTMTTGSCQEGYYCPAGSTWPFAANQNCAVTEYCPTGSYQVSTCAAGTYQPNPMQPDCYACPAGFYCTTAVTNDLTDYKCPKGHYCPESTSSSTQYPCPAGTYNDHYGATSSSECIQSPPGYYISTTAAVEVTTANLCTAGYYCQRGSTTATQYQCTTGNYCPQGAPKMISCTPGKRCTTNGLSTPNADCSSTKYCVQGTGSGSGTTCPAGYYCPTASGRPTPCPAGTYGQYTGRDDSGDCATCPAGYYCPTPALTWYSSYVCRAGFYCVAGSVVDDPTVCPLGHYCVAGRGSAVACSDQYQDMTGQTSCKNCPAGHFCTSTTVTKCTPQSEGLNYYCPGGAVSVGKVSCASGTYNYVDGSESSSDCWACPPGFFCPDAATTVAEKVQTCTQGYYCHANTVTPTICPQGFYCPEGTAMPIPCQRGYYGGSTGLYTSTCTGPCNAGYYCGFELSPTIYNSGYGTCINNDNTYYYGTHGCWQGSTDASPSTQVCGAGTYCPAGSLFPTLCPIGTYNTNTPRHAVTDCVDCDAGDYCYERGLTGPGTDCKGGYYCPTGSDESSAEECPAGAYCPAGSSTFTQCIPGTYQTNEVQQSCNDCGLGYYCPDTGMTNPTICPVGYYCDQAAGSTTTSCPVGTWSNIEGLRSASECLMCPFGKWCQWSTTDSSPMTSIADAQECSTTKKCFNRSGTSFTQTDEQSTTYACGVNEICTTNTIVPTYCEPGTYTNPSETSGMAAANCLQCDAEKYCDEWGMSQSSQKDCFDGYVCLGGAIHPSNLDDVTIKLCPAGSYCPGSSRLSTEAVENVCPINYYNPMLGQTTCVPCEAGFSCQATGLITPTPCPAGSYCPAFVASSSIANVIPCPAGTYSSDEYLTDVSQCNSCPPGKYCEAGSSTFTGYCTQGYACIGGADTATPTGTFGFVDYAASNNGPCPVGHYCPYGTAYPRKCAAGTYQDTTGSYECKACDQYKYCDMAGLSAPTGYCDPGFYCITGSTFAKPYDYAMGAICGKGNYCANGQQQQCPGGSYAPVEGLALCYNCPPGFYCNEADGTINPVECTTGHYCPQSTENPYVCPLGTYTQAYMTGLEMSSQCSNCTTGYYCDDGTYDSTKKCLAGYYCLSGAYEKDQEGLECPTGFYCTEGTKLPTACPDGKYSLRGAQSEDNCTDCLEGYYCVRYTTSSAMVECPKGYYCPYGVDAPIPCPKGTFNNALKKKSSENCNPCPAGTACDVTGISDYKRKLCPPGYYCERGSFSPAACPPGTFRPLMGAGAPGPESYTVSVAGGGASTCYKCVPGYYCPTKATVVPELCPAGYFCQEGQDQPQQCPAGFYCPSGAADKVPCPPGYYCLGQSDVYLKCPFGTFCSGGASQPTNCPNGMYGSGNINNFDVESGCKKCGRGMYSEDDPTVCVDCTPGYVCLGATSAAFPTNVTSQNGYKCPKGHYCPIGSYKETPCPIGKYAKNEGASSEFKCLPCKFNWYNDLVGQGGCKKCGPTSYAEGGATTCTCIGANRNFIKGSGACLCTIGFKPTNNGTNTDSAEDCEAIVNPPCTEDEETSLTGQCLDQAAQDKECERQCPDTKVNGVTKSGGGKMVKGTGLCQCTTITEIDEICNTECQKTRPKSSLNAKGLMTITDPETGQANEIDPSSLPGYFGTFTCETTDASISDCSMRQMGMTADGSFTYEFTPNTDLLTATDTPTKEDTTTASLRRAAKRKRDIAAGRSLQGNTVEQGDQAPSIRNPAMCVKQNDIVFFNVNVDSLSYPTYLKDAQLNNNPDFDSAPFSQLEKQILDGVQVQTFSYSFKQPGIYVFTNKATGTMTTITVVAATQECEGSEDGVGVGMVTTEKLASFGVTAKEKGIQPNWVFISLSLVGIFCFLVIGLGLLSRAKGALEKGTRLFQSDADVRDSAIYYKELANKDNKKYNYYCCGLWRTKKSKVDQDASTSSSDDEKKKHEYSLKYRDLETLLLDFNRAQEVLNKQLIDREKALKRTVDEDGNLVENLEPEDELLKEVQSLLQFVKQNKDVLNSNLSEKVDDMFNVDMQLDNDNIDNEEIRQMKNPVTKQVALTLRGLVQRSTAKETQFNQKLQNQTKDLQQAAYAREAVRNDQLKTKLLEEYQGKMKAANLTDAERDALLAELHAKLSHINDLAAEEQDHQNHNLQALLEKRKAKREKLKQIIDNLGEKKISEDERYQNKLIEIKEAETKEKLAVDAEMDDLRRNSMKEMTGDLQQKRISSLGPAEKRLEDFKRRQGKGHNPENDLQFQDMLADYGKMVKKLDADLVKEREDQTSTLEQKLRDRKQKRLREIEVARKEKEVLLNAETVKTTSKLNTEMKQIESLLDPIKDEEDRMAMILAQSNQESALVDNDGQTPGRAAEMQITLSDEAKQAQEQLSQTDDKKEISQMLTKIDTENEIKRREIEQQKQMIQKQIDNSKSEDEKARLLKQMEMFDSNLTTQLAQQQDQQARKLKEAIEARKAKRKSKMDLIAKEKEQKVISMFKKSANSNVKQITGEDQVKGLAAKIQAGFSKDESVQATENYLDQKNQEESMALMNKLFEERARALRVFMVELLTQKQSEFQLLSEEYEPQKEFLRQKRVKGLIGLDEFTAALERITIEETERHQDIEIAYADKEKAIKQELEILKLQADAEQQKLLKDRQTKEKVLMFGQLMQNMEDGDQMKNYIKKSVQEADRELTQFKLFQDKEKAGRMSELQEDHAKQIKDLEERQERLVNVEEMLKKDEAKHMERFRRQREEMLARKLADQQRELLKDMNQKDVDQMLDRHKRDLSQMDEVLVEEQARQMEQMRERMKKRTAAKAREQVTRQIKLAEINKAKHHEAQQAKLYEQSGGDLATSVLLERQKEQVNRLVEKASLMQRMCQKQCYSRKIFFKRHIANQQKLNAFLGRGILVDWASSKDGAPGDAVSGMSMMSLDTDVLKEQINEKEEQITYSVLLEHIHNAETSYEQIRKQH